MPSPFPGMNPYLEQDDVWHDFHERFLPAAAEAIGVQVQPDYRDRRRHWWASHQCHPPVIIDEVIAKVQTLLE
jgi:hypothetical protein